MQLYLKINEHKIQFIMELTGYNSVSSWGVAVACSFVTCMARLPLKLSGMLFVAFLSSYDTDRQTASLFVVIHMVLANCLSPLIGYLGEIFVLRNLVVLGCLFSSLGVGICYFAEGIITVTISIGCICGIGVCLQLTLLPQIIKQHFTKNLSIAYGVTWMGFCVGSFVVVPTFKTLLDMYGISGALLISSGIMLHSVPVAMLLRDPKYNKKAISFCDKQREEKEQNVNKSIKEVDGLFMNSDHSEKILNDNPTIKDNETSIKGNRSVTLKPFVTVETEFKVSYQKTRSCHEPPQEGNLHPIVNSKFQPSINLMDKIDIDQKHEHSSKEITKGSASNHSLRNEKQNKYIVALKAWSILRNPPFLVIMFCQSASGYIDVFVSTTIIDISRDKGIPQSQEHFFLILYSAGQIVGYTCLGWVTDKGYLTAARYYCIGSLCMGLSCCGLVFSDSFSTMVVSIVCVGLCVSVYNSVGPNLVYEYLEETKQSMAISSRYILNAPLSFTIGPIVGYFRGTLGSYDGVLYLLAALSTTCAALLLCLPCIAKCTNRKNSTTGSEG